MKNFIKSKLEEAFNVSSLRIPKKVVLNDEEKDLIKKLSWRDLKINDLGGKGNIAYLSIDFPFETNASDGIVVDIQVLGKTIYQIHIHMSDDLQGLGLGYKIHKAIIIDFGHLYLGKGRVLNPLVNNIWDKLKNDSEIECISNETGDLCMTKDNPNKSQLVGFMS